MTHKRPIDIPLTLSEEVVTGWEVEDKFPCRCVYETKYRHALVAGLFENDRSLKKYDTLVEVSGNPGSYYFDQLIGALHVHSHQPINDKDLVIRSISYQRELRDSQKGLEDRGFHVQTFVSPYNYWTEETRALSKYYYAQAANGGESPNYKESYDPHWLKRYLIHSLGSADEVIRLLQKKLAASDSWVTLCFHGTSRDYTAYFENLSSDRIQVSIDLESDRMQNLNLREDDFRTERMVVMEERRLRTRTIPRLCFRNSLKPQPFRHNLIIGPSSAGCLISNG